MKTLRVIISVLLWWISNSAMANCYSKYDYSSGNYYRVCDNSDSTTTTGYNYNTGSTWRQTNNSDNTYNGYDSDGNYYRGNNNTGSYYNYGTGKTCYGKGKHRTCY